MAVRLNPYLSFQNNAREAMTHYHSVLGGKLDVSTFGEFGMSDDPAQKDLVMHSMLETDDGMVLMGADTPPGTDYQPGGGFSVSLSGDSEADLRRYWEGLSAGGNVLAPLEPAPWGDTFGMCVDRFGVTWLVNITAAQ